MKALLSILIISLFVISCGQKFKDYKGVVSQSSVIVNEFKCGVAEDFQEIDRVSVLPIEENLDAKALAIDSNAKGELFVTGSQYRLNADPNYGITETLVTKKRDLTGKWTEVDSYEENSSVTTSSSLLALSDLIMTGFSNTKSAFLREKSTGAWENTFEKTYIPPIGQISLYSYDYSTQQLKYNSLSKKTYIVVSKWKQGGFGSLDNPPEIAREIYLRDPIGNTSQTPLYTSVTSNSHSMVVGTKEGQRTHALESQITEWSEVLPPPGRPQVGKRFTAKTMRWALHLGIDTSEVGTRLVQIITDTPTIKHQGVISLDYDKNGMLYLTGTALFKIGDRDYTEMLVYKVNPATLAREIVYPILPNEEIFKSSTLMKSVKLDEETGTFYYLGSSYNTTTRSSEFLLRTINYETEEKLNIELADSKLLHFQPTGLTFVYNNLSKGIFISGYQHKETTTTILPAEWVVLGSECKAPPPAPKDSAF